MEVIAGGVGILGLFVPEVKTRVQLVRSLVLRESRIPVDPEQRAPLYLGIGSKMRTDV